MTETKNKELTKPYNPYMAKALEYARIAFTKNEVPIGSVIVNNIDSQIIGWGYNQVKEFNDKTLHAEISAIKMASKHLNSTNLKNCSLFSTIEPCLMCAGAIMHYNIGKIYFGATEEKYGCLESNSKVFYKHYNYKPEIYMGIMEEECKILMQDFFKQLR
jgi:tRNA(adenine34) deaminase